MKDNIDKENYTQSISPQDFITEMMISSTTIIEELFSTSKSGSLFYHTRDGKFILKTLLVKEYKFFKAIFPEYYRHMLDNPNSLLPKFYGCYKLVRRTKHEKQRFYFVTMDNIFSTARDIHLKYDLKGSTISRDVLSTLPENERNKDVYEFSLKDLDLEKHKQQFVVGDKREIILKQLAIDSEFLRNQGILDYSLLIGVHKTGANLRDSDNRVNQGKFQSRKFGSQQFRFNRQSTRNHLIDSRAPNSDPIPLMSYNVTEADLDDPLDVDDDDIPVPHEFKDVKTDFYF